MTQAESRARVLHLADGVSFSAGPDHWLVPPLTMEERSWVALIPHGPEPVVDPSVNLSRVLATMYEPAIGSVELFGRNVYRLDYGERQRMRARIGFVHGFGGLLSGRSIAENIGLPVTVHGRMGRDEEAEAVAHILRTFGLSKVAELRPHEVDGGTRWNVCLARAMALRPRWLVMEGIGNWEMDRGRSTSWKALMDRRHTSRMATAICLPRQNPGFEAWFEKHGGALARYARMKHPPAERRKA